jgi:ring-1,2-phenylacetyl-CoA epoxidase subunit PaaE
LQRSSKPLRSNAKRRKERKPMATRFHRLRVKQVRKETPYAVVVAFEVPARLEEAFRFTQGQFLTLRARIDGEELRRSYSICSGAHERELRVAIKRVEDGKFSPWANERLRRGDALEVMPPDGKFFVPLDSANRKHYVAFAAGSGITPVLSLVKTTLAVEPASRFTLVYGNRFVSTIMFCEELEDLKDRYLGRFTLYHVLSRDHQEIELFNGRIDRAKCAALFDTLLPPADIDEAFVCGPAGMIEEVGAALAQAGLPKERVHVERFLPAGEPPPPVARVGGPTQLATGPGAEVTVIVDGQKRSVFVPYGGESILDMALHAGADLPFACKAGVCCTCRAKLVEGEVRMDRNFGLDEAELARGFVLTCQSHPVTPSVVVNYDER